MFDSENSSKNKQNNPFRIHTIEEARKLPEWTKEHSVGNKTVFYDKSLGITCMRVQLDKDWYWFLSIFFDSSTGALKKYCLDYEGASDSHYEFKNEASIRKDLYQAGDENRYIDDLFIRFVGENTGSRLQEKIKPYITAQFHYD